MRDEYHREGTTRYKSVAAHSMAVQGSPSLTFLAGFAIVGNGTGSDISEADESTMPLRCGVSNCSSVMRSTISASLAAGYKHRTFDSSPANRISASCLRQGHEQEAQKDSCNRRRNVTAPSVTRAGTTSVQKNGDGDAKVSLADAGASTRRFSPLKRLALANKKESHMIDHWITVPINEARTGDVFSSEIKPQTCKPLYCFRPIYKAEGVKKDDADFINRAAIAIAGGMMANSERKFLDCFTAAFAKDVFESALALNEERKKVNL